MHYLYKDYRKYSSIQSFFIIITGISVFDFGYSNNDRELGFNKLLFETLISPNALWGTIQFWGYCFLIVGYIQFIKGNLSLVNNIADIKLNMKRGSKSIPGVKQNLMFSPTLLRLFQKYTHEMLLNFNQQGGDITEYRIFHVKSYLISNPDVVRVILTNPQKFKKSFHYDFMKPLLGNGLLTMPTDELWKYQRDHFQEAFTKEKINEYSLKMNQLTRHKIDQWENQSIVQDFFSEMMELTFDIISQTMFNVDLSDRISSISESLSFLIDFSFHRSTSIIKIPYFIPTPSNLKIWKSNRILKDVVKFVHSNILNSTYQNDTEITLSKLIRFEIEKGNLSERQAKDHILTFLLAGHETTSTALTWTVYLLAKHPKYQEEIYSELRSITKENSLNVQDLKKTKLVKMVIQEAMRLYPPVWILGRTPVNDEEILNYRIKKGSIVVISPYVMHRNPVFWIDPELFQPERFLDNTSYNSSSFIPFSTGPRSCIGASFAMMEAQLILSQIILNYEFRLLNQSSLKVKTGLTLRPSGDVDIIIRIR